MDYGTAIQRVYDYLENGQVDKAVMGCLRIARHLNDHFYAAIFLREMYPDNRELTSVFYDDTRHLNEKAQTFLWESRMNIGWIHTRFISQPG